MSEPRERPADETPITAWPAWNQKALNQFVDWIREQGGAFEDEDEQREDGDRPGYRWALRRLVLAGALRVRRRVGRRVTYEVS